MMSKTRKIVVALLLFLLISNTLTPMLISRAENQPKSESFWEKVEDKLIQHAYEMAKSRHFIDYFFIPGVGGGEQPDLKGTEGLYVVLFLLPAIQSETTQSTKDLLKKIITDSFDAVLHNIASGKEVNEVIFEFCDKLKTNMENLRENVVSFYLPYQKMMFRVIAVVWIKSSTLMESLTTNLIEKTLGASFHFMKKLVDKKIDELRGKIEEEINELINNIKDDIENNIRAYTSFSEEYEENKVPIYNDKGEKIGEKIEYDVTVTAFLLPEKVTDIVEQIKNAMIEIQKLENYYRSFEEILEGDYSEVTSAAKESGMYEKLYERLKESLSKIEMTTKEINDIKSALSVTSDPIEDHCDTRDCPCVENLRNSARDNLKDKLKSNLDEKISNILKTKINDFLNGVKKPLEKMFRSLYPEADEKMKEISEKIGEYAESVVKEAAKKHPIAAAIYLTIDATHQFFAGTLTGFHYWIEPPDNIFIESEEKIEYAKEYFKKKGKMIEGEVNEEKGLFEWIEAAGRAVGTAFAHFISKKDAGVDISNLVDYIPQLLIFDVDFSRSSKDKVSVITGGEPGIYLLSGSIEFKNIYSSVEDFLGKIGGWLRKNKKYAIKEDNYGIFAEDINKELPSEESNKNVESQEIPVKFFIPYIVASALPVLRNITKIDGTSVSIKMAAIMDIGSFIKPLTQETRENLKRKLNEGINSFVEEVFETFKKVYGRIEEEFKKKIEGDSKGKNDLLQNILEEISKKISDIITITIVNIINIKVEQVKEKMKGESSHILTWLSKQIDVTSEKLEDFISITTSVIAIPVRGMKNRLKIIVPSIGISESIDGLGYCEIIISKKSLINFSAPISAIRSYVAFSDGDAIGLIPYSMYSYEPLVVQVFTKIISWPNEFKVMHIINPEEEIQGVSIETKKIETKNELIGTKLVILRGNNDKNVELRYIPNPYPYAETYVKLNIG